MPVSADHSTSIPIADGWRAASAAPDACPGPDGFGALDWLPARVPGTAAGALADAGLEPGALDSEDWWFRVDLPEAVADHGEEVVLRLDGIATVAEVFLDGERVLESRSMFERHEIPLGSRLRSGAELSIRCRALAPMLAVPRKPRARWRTRLVDNNLRWFRTMLLGRAPGIAPGPAAVGPWRPVILERRRHVHLDELRLRTSMDGDDGVLSVRVAVRGIGAAAPETVEAVVAGQRCAIALDDGRGAVEIRIPAVERWWPHTHGRPVLHDLTIELARGQLLAMRRVGFRELGWAADIERDGLDLHVNGVPVFARGAVWAPFDLTTLAPSREDVRATLLAARDAGMNMIRVVGTGAYESEAFHDLCDELGLLVWQDFMFANLDYPIADDDFRSTVEREVRQVLGDLGGRPSLAVLCGNSEVEQQAAMLGVDSEAGREPLFGELLPAWIDDAAVRVPYVPSAPCGGTLPFRTDCGISHYFGVGAYRRPVADARSAAVRFAAECLAFSNVPAVEDLGKDGVPRDAGADWDFEDVRDTYLSQLAGVDAASLARSDRERYLTLSRWITGEVMAEVLGEWRRAGSPCKGALILWLRDQVPGAGWGLLDHRGSWKPVLHQVRRALAPIAVWTTDEGLNGIGVHVANDTHDAVNATVRVALYRDQALRVFEAREELLLPPHATHTTDVERLLGHFVDASFAYRFGPPGHDAVVVSLESADALLLSQSFRFPLGRPLTPEPAERLGLEARLEGAALHLSSARVVFGVHVDAPGFNPSDDLFCLEPGRSRVVRLEDASGGRPPRASISAINLDGALVAGPA